MISTYNAYHLGDNLVHLNFMRRLAQKHPDQQFGHYAAAQHTTQLTPLVQDLPNLKLLAECPPDAVNAWRGDNGYWHTHAQRNDFVAFHLDWFAHLAKQMGLESPVKTAADMMFDYPALAPAEGTDHFEHPQFDVLVINSIPHSGQFRGFNSHDFDAMIRTLISRGLNVTTTFPSNTPAPSTHDGTSGLSVTAIGRLSTAARVVLGMVTGPSWPTMNVWNKGKKFIWMLDDERVEIMPNTAHVHSCGEALSKV